MATIFFDLDNTLTDRAKTVGAYAEVFIRDFSHLLNTQLDVREFGSLLNKYDDGGYAGHELRSTALTKLPIWRKAVTSSQLVDHWQGWVPHHSMPMDGLYDCLNELKVARIRAGAGY